MKNNGMKHKVYLMRQINQSKKEDITSKYTELMKEKGIEEEEINKILEKSINSNENDGNYYIVIKILKFNGNRENPFVKHSKRTYIIDKSSPSYYHNGYYYYYVDIDSAKPIQFTTLDSGMNPQLIDMIVSDSIVQQLAKSMNRKNDTFNIVSIMIGLVIGLMIGALIATIIYTNKIQEIMESTQNNAPIIINYLKLLRK